MRLNQIKKIGKVAILLLGVLFLTNCSKKNSNSSASNNGYYMDSSGACRSYTTGAMANTSLCQSGYNNGYNNGNTGGGTACYGQYYDMYGQMGTCNGANCSGYTLYNMNGQMVQCL